ncbi:putative transferase, protein kinase RLK-Pelle-LRR-III family [Helianthus annuus]|nr:putative transferase, protein kinase RLK-Pelle-LRR-III family [Helianthus annuus]
MEGNKLVLFDNGVYSFDLEDLLKASAVFLGEGSVGKSYKQVIQDNTTVVVKRLKDVVVTENEFKRTMEGLGSIKNKNIFVPLIGYYYSRDERLVIYDYIPARSLSALLHGKFFFIFSILNNLFRFSSSPIFMWVYLFNRKS